MTVEFTPSATTAVNALLLNEFVKEHAKVEELKSVMGCNRPQRKEFGKRLKELHSKLQAVNDRIDRTAPLRIADEN